MSPLTQFTAWLTSLFFMVSTPMSSPQVAQYPTRNQPYEAMLESINSAHNYCKDNPGCSISEITKKQGDFIEVNVAFKEAGGALALLKNNDDGYTFIQMYQEPPSCTLMKTFDVPRSLYKACYDNNGKLIE